MGVEPIVVRHDPGEDDHGKRTVEVSDVVAPSRPVAVQLARDAANAPEAEWTVTESYSTDAGMDAGSGIFTVSFEEGAEPSAAVVPAAKEPAEYRTEALAALEAAPPDDPLKRGQAIEAAKVFALLAIEGRLARLERRDR